MWQYLKLQKDFCKNCELGFQILMYCTSVAVSIWNFVLVLL